MKSDLQKAQQKITKRATKLANKRARDELLAPNSAVLKRLSYVTGRHIEWLRKEWSPFDPDYTTKSGLGMKLTVQKDKLVRMVLEEEKVYERLREIAVEAMTDTMVNTSAQSDDSTNAADFFGALINDLLEEKPFYSVGTRE